MIPPAPHPFVFIHIPCTGGTTTGAALVRYLPGWKGQHDRRMTCPENSGPVFAFVRNPWDWAVAMVADLRKRGHADYVDCTWREGLLRLAEEQGAQSASLCDATGHVAVDWTGRFERLEEDFAEICERLELPRLTLERRESADVPDYREVYDDETREVIGQRYAVDAAVFGYEFDGPCKDTPAGLIGEAELRQQWLAWLGQNGQSAVGWRGQTLNAAEISADHSRYEGLKKWGWYLPDAQQWIRHFRSDTPVKALEIGAFDGVSAALMLDVLFPHPVSEVHAVDPYLPDPTTPQVSAQTRELFLRNRLTGGHGERMKLYEGLSAEVLAWMTATEGYWESFDFIYVDGSHMAKDVFIDAAMSWNLLKPGGVIGFDDFEWGDPAYPHRRPQRAIIAFEDVFGDRLGLIFDGWRRFYRKLKA